MPRRPRILITLGDPCGISAELLLGSLATLSTWGEVTVVGARAGADLLEGQPSARVAWTWTPLPMTEPCPAPRNHWELRTFAVPIGSGAPEGRATWIDSTPEVKAADLALGQASGLGGRCAVEAVRVAVERLQADQADALVTLPLSKSAAHLAGYPIPGHTEYLQQLTGSPITRMAFASPSLNVVLHTVHQSLRSVVEDLDPAAVAETLAFAADRFIQLTGRMDLRVALCALNPHAGEGGAFGNEERLLTEALNRAEAAFRQVPAGIGPFAHVPSPFGPETAPADWRLFPSAVPRANPADPVPEHPAPRFQGPLPADSVFLRALRGEFDLVVALFHDQGLIPIKLLEPARSVNLTLGLPFIRTSPDHGTAFDRAGAWTSDPTNFMEATALAVRLAGRARREPWTADAGGATP